MTAAEPGLARVCGFVLAGPLAAAAHFTLAYVPQAVLCARASEGPLVVWLPAISGAVLLILSGLIALPHRAARLFGVETGPQAGFLLGLMQALAVLSACGVMAALWAMATLPLCGSLQ